MLNAIYLLLLGMTTLYVASSGDFSELSAFGKLSAVLFGMLALALIIASIVVALPHILSTKA